MALNTKYPRQIALAPLREAIEDYLRCADADIRARVMVNSEMSSQIFDPLATSTEVFQILTSQRFGYLGRRKSEPYRAMVESKLAAQVSRGEPLRFYFDLGPGYHAGIYSHDCSLNFEASLSELLVLRQMILFANEVRTVYPPGIHFFVVIDNLCGRYTNDIPLENSMRYVGDFRRLIQEMGADDLVSLLVESEYFSCEQYECILDTIDKDQPMEIVSDAMVDNVSRFLGRKCSRKEAGIRIERYRRTAQTTEILLADKIDGVRLTQRATPTTLGFRPFPGGDQRTQAGSLAFTRKSNGKLRPLLITTQNSEQYDLLELSAFDSLPKSVRSVLYADPLDQ